MLGVEGRCGGVVRVLSVMFQAVSGCAGLLRCWCLVVVVLVFVFVCDVLHILSKV